MLQQWQVKCGRRQSRFCTVHGYLRACFLLEFGSRQAFACGRSLPPQAHAACVTGTRFPCLCMSFLSRPSTRTMSAHPRLIIPMHTCFAPVEDMAASMPSHDPKKSLARNAPH